MQVPAIAERIAIVIAIMNEFSGRIRSRPIPILVADKFCR
jgi:hypothetical protein